MAGRGSPADDREEDCRAFDLITDGTTTITVMSDAFTDTKLLATSSTHCPAPTSRHSSPPVCLFTPSS